MTLRQHCMILIAALGGFLALEACASNDFVVIANVNSGLEKMTKDEVINVYMGRNRKLPSGISAIPLDLSNPLSEKANFYNVMVNKELSEISSYWARLLFSGQGSPPKQLKDADEALEYVMQAKGAIAYIDRKKADKRIKIVYDPLK